MSFADRLIAIGARRAPDFVIGDRAEPYLKRSHIIPRNPPFNIYLHQILRSDDDRALHDHPWVNCSILLRGEYLEWLPGDIAKHRLPGSIIFRRATAAHRLALIIEYTSHGRLKRAVPCWTLFITGPRIREWGFHCPRGWVPWKIFTNPAGKGQIGKGCD